MLASPIKESKQEATTAPNTAITAVTTTTMHVSVTSNMPTIASEVWTLEKIQLFLPWAMQLFTKGSEIYLASSFKKNVLRTDPDEEDLLKFKEVLFTYLNDNSKNKSAKELSDVLKTHLPKISDDRKMLCWGALIKISFKQAELIDLSDQQVQKYHGLFIDHLKKLIKNAEKKEEKIQDCFELFFKKLEAIGHGQSALAARSFIRLYKLIFNEWLAAMENDSAQVSKSLGVYLGPGLLYGLKLNDKLITEPKHGLSPKTREFKFMQKCVFAVLSDSQAVEMNAMMEKLRELRMQHAKSVVAINPLHGKDLSKIYPPKQTLTMSDKTISYNPLYGADLSRLKNPTQKQASSDTSDDTNILIASKNPRIMLST